MIALVIFVSQISTNNIFLDKMVYFARLIVLLSNRNEHESVHRNLFHNSTAMDSVNKLLKLATTKQNRGESFQLILNLIGL